MNKREKTPERGTSDEVEQHETPRDVSEEDSYMEPLEVPPPATSQYQSLHRTDTSAKYYNVVSNSGNNGQEDELYLTIIP